MTDTDNGHETRMTRREALRGGSAVAVATGAFLMQKQLVRQVSAQTNEPRISLGDDWAIDDNPDGAGSLSIDHTPNSTEFGFSEAGAFSTPSLDVDGVRSDYHLTEDPNSPHSASGVTSIDVPVADPREYMVIQGTVTNQTANTTAVTLKINGVSQNYINVRMDGSVTIGDSSYQNIVSTSDASSVTFKFNTLGVWRETHMCTTLTGSPVNILDQLKSGGNSTPSSPLDNLLFQSGSNAHDFYIEVYGVDV